MHALLLREVGASIAAPLDITKVQQPILIEKISTHNSTMFYYIHF